jgi:formylglycine-generating enzyme required for sulfatase activity
MLLKKLSATAATTPAVTSSGRVPGTVFRDYPNCPEMVVVPAASFTMGSSASEKSLLLST